MSQTRSEEFKAGRTDNMCTFRKKLVDDLSGGHHVYIWACRACAREVGSEWVEVAWAKGKVPACPDSREMCPRQTDMLRKVA